VLHELTYLEACVS